MAILAFARYMLANVASFLLAYPPFIRLYVDEVEVMAGIAFIASQNYWKK
jgi:hypothetical protein